MEPEHSTSSIYRSVIDDVVSRVKPEFVGEGVDECALLDLARQLPRCAMNAVIAPALTKQAG